jgi:hypothetical protein
VVATSEKKLVTFVSREIMPIALLLLLGHTVLYAEAETVYRQAPLQKN